MRRRFQQALNIDIEVARVGDMGVAQAKGQLGGLNDAVDGHRLVGLGHRQAIGNAENGQRYQPLGRRREVPQLAVLMGQF